jgi:hypothetical protein
MKLGSMMDQAKEKASSAKESAKNPSGAITQITNDFNAALPVLRENGIKLEALEIEIGLVPKLIPHLDFSKEITEDDKNNMLESCKDNKVATLLIKAIYQANELKNKINVGSLKFAGVEIEATLTPSVKLKFA